MPSHRCLFKSRTPPWNIDPHTSTSELTHVLVPASLPLLLISPGSDTPCCADSETDRRYCAGSGVGNILLCGERFLLVSRISRRLRYVGST